MDSVLVSGIAIALGTILLGAGLVKLRAFWQFVGVVRTWGFERPSVARAVAAGVILGEVVAGVFAVLTALIGGVTVGLVAVVAVLIVFAAGQMVLLVRGTSAKCGCFGRPTTIGLHSVVRTAGLAVLALAAAGLATMPVIAQSVPSWAYPASTTTGIASVDEAIAAIRAGDATDIREALAFTPTACSTNPGLGGLQCPPGTPNGTVLPAIFAGSCELAGLVEGSSEMESVLSSLVASSQDGLFLYAVARADGGSDHPAEPYYWAFFGRVSDPAVPGGSVSYSPVTLGIDEEGITAIVSRCAASVADAAARPGLEFILAPVSAGGAAATQTPGAPPTGNGVTQQSDPVTSQWPLWAVGGVGLLLATGGLVLWRRRDDR